MGCWHGNHSYGCSGERGPRWYADDPYAAAERPTWWGEGRPRRHDAEAADGLESRLSAVRDELRRVEAELADLRAERR